MPGVTNGTRFIALVGPAGAGKTSLAEAFLYASGTTDRQGSVAAGSSIGLPKGWNATGSRVPKGSDRGRPSSG